MDTTSPGQVAGIALLVTALSHLVLPLAKYFGQRGVESRKLTLETVRADQERLDNSYKRLETENARLWNRVNNLEQALVLEREELTKEREAHEGTRGRCDKVEAALRRAGIKLDANGDHIL